MPGIFLGGLIGGRVALRLPPEEMWRLFAILLLPVCAWEILPARLGRF